MGFVWKIEAWITEEYSLNDKKIIISISNNMFNDHGLYKTYMYLYIYKCQMLY